MDGFSNVIQTKVVLAKAKKIFFQEVEFNFCDIYPQGIFMVENVTEKVEVQPYCTKGNAVMFNAWIYKNIAYKVYDDAMVDKAGNPTVIGGIRHMTKVIEFGGVIELPEGTHYVPSCKNFAEVLSAKVIGSHDQLLGKVEILKPSCMPPMMPQQYGQSIIGQQGGQSMMKQQPIRRGCAAGAKPNDGMMEMCHSKSFEPPIYQYTKLIEKMAIEIEVKVVTTKHLRVLGTDADADAEGFFEE